MTRPLEEYLLQELGVDPAQVTAETTAITPVSHGHVRITYTGSQVIKLHEFQDAFHRATTRHADDLSNAHQEALDESL